jgi:glycosyltransferase involved in cell wall biosynthesis
MKILIVHQYFKTPEEGGGIRTWHIAKYLSEKGNQVTVLSAHNTLKGTHHYHDFEVRYFKIRYDNSMGFIRRLLSFFGFVAACKKYLKQNHDFQEAYVLTTPLTTGIIGLELTNKYDIPFHFEVGDLWPDVPIELGIIKNKLLKGLLLKFEKRIYNHSKSIVALSPAIKDRIEKKVSNKPVHIMTNFADCEWIGERKLDTSSFSFTNPFIIAYYGAMGYANHIECIFDIASICAEQNLPVKFTLMGFGAFASETKNQVANFENVEWVDPGGMNEVKNLLLESHATYISYLNQPILETGSPNKFFDGLTAHHLIITNFKGWIGELIEKEGCGFYYEPKNPSGFIDKLAPYLDSIEKYNHAQIISRKLAEKRFDKNVQLKILEKVF